MCIKLCTGMYQVIFKGKAIYHQTFHNPHIHEKSSPLVDSQQARNKIQGVIIHKEEYVEELHTELIE